jgi:simple sugar transport system permease protein
LPIRAELGALLFGAAVSLPLQLQAHGVNVSAFLLGMTPYILTLIVLAIASRGQAQKMPAGLKAVFAPGGA